MSTPQATQCASVPHQLLATSLNGQQYVIYSGGTKGGGGRSRSQQKQKKLYKMIYNYI